MPPPRKRVDPDDTNAGSKYPAKHRASRDPGKHPIGSRIPMAGPDSHEGDERGERRRGKRGGPKHYADDPPRKRAPKKAAPTSSAPTAPSSGSSPRTAPTMAAGPATRRAAARAERVGEEARYLAQQAAIRGTTAKPTVTGRAAAGAASGAAVGTALGGPVGTAVGGGVGAVVGGVSGASAKKAYRAAMRPYPGARRALVAEFAVCAVLVALSPMTNREQKPGQWMRRMTAIMGLFFILGLVSTGGRWGARAAAGFGGIVTLALVVSERRVFGSITGAFSTTRDGSASFGAAPPGVDSGSSSMSGGIDDMQPAEGG